MTILRKYRSDLSVIDGGLEVFLGIQESNDVLLGFDGRPHIKTLLSSDASLLAASLVGPSPRETKFGKRLIELEERAGIRQFDRMTPWTVGECLRLLPVPLREELVEATRIYNVISHTGDR